MSQKTQNILHSLREYEETVLESRGLEFRLNLAEIVIRQLRSLGWTQRDLASETGMKESFISRVLHSNANCTLDTIGKLFFALGINARIEEVHSIGEGCLAYVHIDGKSTILTEQDIAHAKETVCTEGTHQVVYAGEG